MVLCLFLELPHSQPPTKIIHHVLLLLPGTHVAVQLLVELRCEQVGGQGSTLPAWQSSSVTNTMLLRQPEKKQQNIGMLSTGWMERKTQQIQYYRSNIVQFFF